MYYLDYYLQDNHELDRLEIVAVGDWRNPTGDTVARTSFRRDAEQAARDE
jgi:hypothetical protein